MDPMGKECQFDGLDNIERASTVSAETSLKRPSLWRRMRNYDYGAYMKHELRQSIPLEIFLTLITFATGISDVATYGSYRTLVSKQTGNVIFLFLEAFSPEEYSFDLEAIATSMALFISGAIITGHITKRAGFRIRWYLFLVNFIQGLFVLSAIIIRFEDRPPVKATRMHRTASLASLALLAFESGSQISMALDVIPDINTFAITITIVTLCKFNWFKKETWTRGNIRKVTFVSVWTLGALIGAMHDKLAVEHFDPMWFVFIVKMLGGLCILYPDKRFVVVEKVRQSLKMVKSVSLGKSEKPSEEKPSEERKDSVPAPGN